MSVQGKTKNPKDTERRDPRTTWPSHKSIQGILEAQLQDGDRNLPGLYVTQITKHRYPQTFTRAQIANTERLLAESLLIQLNRWMIWPSVRIIGSKLPTKEAQWIAGALGYSFPLKRMSLIPCPGI